MTGFSSGGIIITFALAKASVPSHLSGTVSGVINMGVMMGPILLQPEVGWILDQKWQGDVIRGTILYTLDVYQTGFPMMIAWAVLSFLLFFSLVKPIAARQRDRYPRRLKFVLLSFDSFSLNGTHEAF